MNDASDLCSIIGVGPLQAPQPDPPPFCRRVLLLDAGFEIVYNFQILHLLLFPPAPKGRPNWNRYTMLDFALLLDE